MDDCTARSDSVLCILDQVLGNLDLEETVYKESLRKLVRYHKVDNFASHCISRVSAEVKRRRVWFQHLDEDIEGVYFVVNTILGVPSHETEVVFGGASHRVDPVIDLEVDLETFEDETISPDCGHVRGQFVGEGVLYPQVRGALAVTDLDNSIDVRAGVDSSVTVRAALTASDLKGCNGRIDFIFIIANTDRGAHVKPARLWHCLGGIHLKIVDSRFNADITLTNIDGSLPLLDIATVHAVLGVRDT